MMQPDFMAERRNGIQFNWLVLLQRGMNNIH